MDLTVYDVIKKPKITEKAYYLNQKLKKLVLEVHPKANKSLIEEALNRLFNVKVEKINIVVSKGKRKRLGRHEFQEKLRKKAIVTLKPGQDADISGLSGGVEIQEPSEPSEKK